MENSFKCQADAPNTLLIVDDDEMNREVLANIFAAAHSIETAENGREGRYPVFPVKAIDSNGAGDTFHGAFVAARLKGMDVYEACRFASATSALKCTRFGAQQGIPGYEEVLEFMKTHEGVVYDG